MGAARGYFFTLEGIEGCGKSTAARYLQSLLEVRGRPTFLTREPGGTALGEMLRAIILSPQLSGDALSPVEQVFLFCASRARLAREVVRPLLESGRDVICDRYLDSTFAYQGVGGSISDEQLNALNRIATQGVVPDLTLLLDLPVEAGLSRRRIGGDINWIDKREIEFHSEVRDRFLRLAAAEPGRIKIVDSSGDQETTRAGIRSILDEFFAINQAGGSART